MGGKNSQFSRQDYYRKENYSHRKVGEYFMASQPFKVIQSKEAIIKKSMKESGMGKKRAYLQSTICSSPKHQFKGKIQKNKRQQEITVPKNNQQQLHKIEDKQDGQQSKQCFNSFKQQRQRAADIFKVSVSQPIKVINDSQAPKMKEIQNKRLTVEKSFMNRLSQQLSLGSDLQRLVEQSKTLDHVEQFLTEFGTLDLREQKSFKQQLEKYSGKEDHLFASIFAPLFQMIFHKYNLGNSELTTLKQQIQNIHEILEKIYHQKQQQKIYEKQQQKQQQLLLDHVKQSLAICQRKFRELEDKMIFNKQ